MVSRTVAGKLGLKADWALGEDNWKGEMDFNLVKLSVLVQGSVQDIVAALPATPAEGAIVILNAAHATNPNQIAVYDEGAWIYILPHDGLLLWNDTTDKYITYTALGGWAELATGSSGGGESGLVKLAELTLTAAQATVTLDNIPQTHTDMILVLQARGTAAANFECLARFNNDSAANYGYCRSNRYGADASDGATSFQLGSMPGSGNSAGRFGFAEMEIANYAKNNTHKLGTGSNFNADGSATDQTTGFHWRNVAPITRLDILPNNATSFEVGSTFILYGRKPVAAGGGGGGSGVAEISAGATFTYDDGAAAMNIRNSKNIASITRVGVGLYDVVFTTPLSDAYYAVSGTAQLNGAADAVGMMFSLARGVAPTVNGFRLYTWYGQQSAADPRVCSFLIHDFPA